MKRIAGLFILLPIGILIVALAVANRQVVTVSIPPQVGDAPLYAFSLPLFALLFAMLFSMAPSHPWPTDIDLKCSCGGLYHRKEEAKHHLGLFFASRSSSPLKSDVDQKPFS